MELVQLLSAAGVGGVIGSLLTTLIQTWFARKQVRETRVFEEKKEAYIGLLDAILASEVSPSEGASLTVGHWHNRCDLVGTSTIRQLLIEYKRTNPVNGMVHPERPTVMQALKQAMRDDLGIAP